MMIVPGHPALASELLLDPAKVLNVMAAITLGAAGGSVLSNSLTLELDGAIEEASALCLSYGLAGAVLFILAPLAPVNESLDNISGDYRLMLSSYLPCIASVAALLIRAATLSLRCR
jgi:hypothetical protein